MYLLRNVFITIWEWLQKIIEMFLCFIFCVWECIVISSIVTILCAVLFYKIGVFESFGKTYAIEPLPLNEPLKTYFYIDFSKDKIEHIKHK